MKRRIAVFANAWSEKNLSDALEGVKKCAIEHDYDLFVFVSHAAPGMGEDEKREEKRIYQLPELEDFDGAIIFSSTMNFPELVQDIYDRANSVNVPVVSVGSKLEGAAFVGMNTMDSMCELVEHLVDVHNVRDVEFIAGPKGNENSEQRIAALIKVFKDNNIPFEKEERIHYGDWSVRGAMDIAGKILENRKNNIPDAIVCANDNLAMAVCAEIEKLGLRIPEDIIVSGFDNVYDGQIFYPSLCTVGQNDYEVGFAAGKMMMSLFEGNEAEDIIIKNEFIKNQSCGCHRDGVEQLRLDECKKRFYEKIKTLEFGWSNNWVSQAALSSSSVDDIKKNLREYLGRSKMFGNGTTYILEDENAKHYFAGKNDISHSLGYSDELDVIVAVEKHKLIPGEKMKRRELIPGYKKEKNNSKIYIFMPIHFQDWVFGYAVVEDWLIGIATGKIKIFVDNFNQTVDKLKQNIVLEHLNSRLRDLYTRDSLTGLYNRFGYDSEGIRIYNDCMANNKKMVIMFTDINRMKLINDYYGHLQGDMAIKSTAEVIAKNIKSDWIAIRFGGDEFLIIGECDNEEEIVSIKDNITDEVKHVGKLQSFPFYLSVSCGYLHFLPEEGRSLDSYIKQTDEAMYDIKSHMHVSDEELKAFEYKCKNSKVYN